MVVKKEIENQFALARSSSCYRSYYLSSSSSLSLSIEGYCHQGDYYTQYYHPYRLQQDDDLIRQKIIQKRRRRRSNRIMTEELGCERCISYFQRAISENNVLNFIRIIQQMIAVAGTTLLIVNFLIVLSDSDTIQSCCHNTPTNKYSSLNIPFLTDAFHLPIPYSPNIHYYKSSHWLTTKPLQTTTTTTTIPQNRKLYQYNNDRFQENEVVVVQKEASSFYNVQEQSVQLAALLVKERLEQLKRQNQQQQEQQLQQQNNTIHVPEEEVAQPETKEDNCSSSRSRTIERLVRGRFVDLTCTKHGEDLLEELFLSSLSTIDSFLIGSPALFEDDDDEDDDDEEVGNKITPSIKKTPTEQERKKYERIIRGAVTVLQSLCVMGTQVGVKGPPEQIKRMVSHLQEPIDTNRDDNKKNVHNDNADNDTWDYNNVRQLKYERNKEPATQLLAQLIRKRTPQGAFDLLVELQIWTNHEDLALLRSGFPIRFTSYEEQIGTDAILKASSTILNQEEEEEEENDDHTDIDTILGIRQDLRHLKVYTIDGESTYEIDDGVSIEKITPPPPTTTRTTYDNNTTNNKNNTNADRYRIWIHIADADYWAPRNSSLLDLARRRITSLYLPSMTIPMFPYNVCTELMSLQQPKSNVGRHRSRTRRRRLSSYALSLGVELNTDGSIIPQSILVTPSIIQVQYHLSYNDVDEMFEEGIGYREEWELGMLLDVANKRRLYRIQNGSSEGIVLYPIPAASVQLLKKKKKKTKNQHLTNNDENGMHNDDDNNDDDNVEIQLTIETSHNAGKNKTASAEVDSNHNNNDRDEYNFGGSSSKSGASGGSVPPAAVEHAPVSSAYLLVTECMILAGEAMGMWKCCVVDPYEQQIQQQQQQVGTNRQSLLHYANALKLPFRSQPPPDYKARSNEYTVLQSLESSSSSSSVPLGYCYAWYIRRFLQPVQIHVVDDDTKQEQNQQQGQQQSYQSQTITTTTPTTKKAHQYLHHSGLGLSYYVQWSSPIRRYMDLQVHTCVKRYLRRKRLFEMLSSSTTTGVEGSLPVAGTIQFTGQQPIHPTIDFGIPSNAYEHYYKYESNETTKTTAITTSITLNRMMLYPHEYDQDINYKEGNGLIGAAKTVQRLSRQYWMYEYILRHLQQKQQQQHDSSSSGSISESGYSYYTTIVLGCIDRIKNSYAIYITEIGLEHVYTSPPHIELEYGTILTVQVDSVNPRAGLLSFVRVV